MFLIVNLSLFCRSLIRMCFIVDLLWSIIILQMVSYFVVFALIIQIIMFDTSESSNKIMFIINMLQI